MLISAPQTGPLLAASPGVRAMDHWLNNTMRLDTLHEQNERLMDLWGAATLADRPNIAHRVAITTQYVDQSYRPYEERQLEVQCLLEDLYRSKHDLSHIIRYPEVYRVLGLTPHWQVAERHIEKRGEKIDHLYDRLVVKPEAQIGLEKPDGSDSITDHAWSLLDEGLALASALAFVVALRNDASGTILDPADCLIGLGIALRESDRTMHSENILRWALYSAASGRAWRELGRTWRVDKKHESSVVALTQAIRENDDPSESFYEMCLTQAKLARPGDVEWLQSAIGFIEKSIFIDCKDVEFDSRKYLTWAGLLLATGDQEKAARVLRVAIEGSIQFHTDIDDHEPELYLELLSIYAKTGQVEMGKALIQRGYKDRVFEDHLESKWHELRFTWNDPYQREKRDQLLQDLRAEYKKTQPIV